MKFENINVYNFEGAFRGMRNPMNSWNKSDSDWDNDFIGPQDLDLAQRLIRAGSEHRKFMRQIFVCLDITAPIFWFKEFDTYRISVTENSTSTMHKLASTPITKDCFELDDFDAEIADEDSDYFINWLESLRLKYLETKDKRYWKELIRWLPEGWLQMRTVTMNYENLYAMVRQRKGHKLTEWKSFIDFVHTLPYADELIFLDYE